MTASDHTFASYRKPLDTGVSIKGLCDSFRNCCRFLAATQHAASLYNSSHNMPMLHFTVERKKNVEKKTKLQSTTRCSPLLCESTGLDA